MRTTDRRRLGWPLALLVLLASSVGAAAAEAPTRREYVEQLEAICKPDALATQRAMKGARSDVQHERLAVAAVKFAKATSIFGGTVKRIAAVPRPPADRERLQKWFAYLTQQERYLVKITAKLRADEPIQAQRLTARFIHNGNLANNVVLAFGFEYCSFKFSRFG
jgi:flagella basal body P-ring formation protein FlgA